MYDTFITYIQTLLSTQLTEDDISAVKQAFTPKKLRKHQYLLQEGEICQFTGFVVKGALKQYTIDENGKENILSLYIENWWAGDRESAMNGTPSPYYIDAWEETELLLTTIDSYKEHLSSRPFMADLIRVLSERQSLQLLKRVHATKTLTAESRLADLEKNYPEFLQRFPQHIIASYLGMTKETLSRIRAQAVKK